MKIKDAFDFYYNGKFNFDLFSDLVFSDNVKEVILNKKLFFSASDDLKVIHNFLSKFIFDSLGVRDDIVFSYRKGVNVVNCIEPHRFSNFIYKTDIESFFPTITKPAIEEAIRKSVCNISYIDHEDIINNLDRILELTTVNGRLPVGFSSSPSISNFIMYDFDCDIYKYATDHGLVYTRYSDDILISSDKEIDKNEITRIISDILSKKKGLNFKINNKKTKIITKKFERIIFGISISPVGTLSVSSKLKKEIEVKIYYLLNNREKLSMFSNMDEKNAILSLSGSLSYVLGIDPSYVTKLRGKYGNAIITKLLSNKEDL